MIWRTSSVLRRVRRSPDRPSAGPTCSSRALVSALACDLALAPLGGATGFCLLGRTEGGLLVGVEVLKYSWDRRRGSVATLTVLVPDLGAGRPGAIPLRCGDHTWPDPHHLGSN